MAHDISLGQILLDVTGNYAEYPSVAKFGDIDGDGDRDIVIGVNSGQGTQGSEIWKNDGNGVFSLHQTLPGLRASDLWLVNIDGDAALEIITHEIGGSARVWDNNGTGTFAPMATPSSNAWDMAVGDVDGDGDLDIVVGRPQLTNQYEIYKNNGAGGFTLASTVTGVGSLRSLALVDLDRNGRLDIVAIEQFAGARGRMLSNDGSGNFSLAGTFGDAQTEAVKVADLSGDGHLDLIVNDSSGSEKLYRNEGGFSLGTQLHEFTPGLPSPSVFGDIDNDGDTDAMGQALLLNGGAGTFTNSNTVFKDPAIAEYGTVVKGTVIGLADVDNDGDLDFLVAFIGNDGSLGGYQSRVRIVTNNAPVSNADGRLGVAGGVTEPVGLHASADTEAEAVNVFDFQLSDGGGGDGLALRVSNLVVHTSGSGDFSKVTWRLNGNDAANVTGTYNAGAKTITFSGLNIVVNDSQSETYVINAYFNDTTGLANGLAYALSIDGDTDVTALGTGTRMAAAQTPVTNGSGSVVTVNAAPTATNLTQALSFTEDQGASVALNDIVVTDSDGGDTLTATLTLGNAAAGALTTGTFGAATSSYSAGTWTVTGTQTDVNAALAAVAFTPAANWDQNVTITTQVRDAAGAGPVNGSITLTATAVNDAPTASNLTQTVNYTEDPLGNVALGDIVISDADTGESFTATLTLDQPAAGSLTTGTFGAATSTYNAGTGVWTVTGTLADTNAALAAVAFTPTANWEQGVAITTRVRDAADTGPADGTITLNVTGTNDAPTLSGGPYSLTGTDEDNASAGTLVSTILAGLTHGDVDAGALSGIAITAAGGSGNWQYSTDGTTWHDVGAVTGADALLLSATTQLRYAPGGANAETSSLSFRAWDQTAGTASTNVLRQTIDAGTNGGSTALSIGSASVTLAVTSVNDAPTVANAIANQGASEDAPFSFQFAANTFADVDVGDTLVYSARLAGGAPLPAWLSFNAATRTFSGTPLNGDVGTLSVEVIADDSHGPTVTDTFDIVVANTNDAPTLANAITNQNATEDAVFSFQFAANTFADVDTGDTLTYTAQLAGGGALPGWLVFDAGTRTFSGTPINDDVGTLSIQVTAADGNASVTNTFDIVVANTNDAPTVAIAIANQGATEDAPFSFQFDAATFADVDVGDSLTYTAQLAAGGALPTWLSFDAATRTFSGTPDNDAVGTLSIAVIANDGNGGSVTDTFDIVVANTNDAPTVAAPIADGSATAERAFGLQFAANAFIDIDVGDTLAYTTALTGGGALPAWLAFDAATRTFSGTPAASDIGTLSIDVTADDGNGGTVTDTFNLVITRPVPPVTPTDPTPVPVDGVPVVTTPGDGGTIIITIPVIPPTRPDDPNSPNDDLADIPLVTGTDGHAILQVSVPVGLGLQVQGLPAPVTGATALAELGLRIARSAGGDAELTNNGLVFLATLDPTVPLVVQTITATAGAGFDPGVPFIINGSAFAGDGMQAVILDARALPSGSTIQVDNVDFIAVVGNVRLVGGAGQNMASGDGSAQYIVLGADDDVIHGGGGNDTVGSKGGDDKVYGDAGDDIVFGGAGNDQLWGGSGSDRLNGGTGFDVAILEGKRSDYTVVLDGAGIQLTHVASGVSDWLVDVEQLRFDTGPSLTIAHSAAEEAAAYLFQQWMGRDLTQSDGAVIQTLDGLSTMQVADLFAQVFPQQAGGRTAQQLLEGMAGAGAIRVDAGRSNAFTGDAGDNSFSPTSGLAWTVDGGAGIDTIVFPATLAQLHVQASDKGHTLQRMTDGAMLTLMNVERLTLSDTKLALDLDGNAGEAAKLLGALGGAAWLDNKPLVGEVIRALDAGVRAQSLAQLGLQLLGANTPGQVTQLLWTNVVGSAATQSQLQPFVEMMAQGVTGGELAVLVSHLDLTATRIDLVGLSATGIEFA